MSDVYQCDNCQRVAERHELPDAKDLHQRIDPGGIFTDKECSECGALSYPVEDVDKLVMGTMESALQHLSGYVEWAKGHNIPLTVGDEEEGYSILDYALTEFDSAYHLMELKA